MDARRPHHPIGDRLAGAWQLRNDDFRWIAVEDYVERQSIATGIPGDLLQPAVARRHVLAISIFRDRHDLPGRGIPDIDARLPFKTDRLVVRRRDHGDAPIRRDGEVVDVPARVDDLLVGHGLQIELPDLAKLVLAMAIFEMLIFRAQARPVVFDFVNVGKVIEEFTVTRKFVGLDAVGNLGDGLGRRLPFHVDAPDLRFAVVRWPLFAVALTIGEEVESRAVGVELRRASAAAVAGQAARLAGARAWHDPQVGLAVIARFLPGALSVRDVLVGEGNLEQVCLREVIGDGDGPFRFGFLSGKRSGGTQSDEHDVEMAHDFSLMDG